MPLAAYPNPFSNEMNLELNEKAKSISIIDYSGRVVYTSANQESGSIIINSSQFPSGTYMLRIQNENSHQIKRIVKL
ncbi:MAG: hypothetical protein ACI86M_003775 [Saprospiraceae bacterium]